MGLFSMRPIKQDEVKIGVVVRFPSSDGTIYGFNDSIIGSVEKDSVVIRRPYVSVGIEDMPFYHGVEVYSMTMESLLSKAVVVYDGSEIKRVLPNRVYLINEVNSMVEEHGFDLQKICEVVYEATQRIIDVEKHIDILADLSDADLVDIIVYIKKQHG